MILWFIVEWLLWSDDIWFQACLSFRHIKRSHVWVREFMNNHNTTARGRKQGTGRGACLTDVTDSLYSVCMNDNCFTCMWRRPLYTCTWWESENRTLSTRGSLLCGWYRMHRCVQWKKSVSGGRFDAVPGNCIDRHLFEWIYKKWNITVGHM